MLGLSELIPKELYSFMIALSDLCDLSNTVGQGSTSTLLMCWKWLKFKYVT